jgi:hypothetical protein
MRHLAAADRSGGCAAGVKSGYAQPGDLLSATPLVAALLGPGFGSTAVRPGPSHESVEVAGVRAASPSGETRAAGLPAQAPSPDEGGGLLLSLALVLMAAMMAAVVLSRGWRMAGVAMQRRSEHAEDRRLEELKDAVRTILDKRG